MEIIRLLPADYQLAVDLFNSYRVFYKQLPNREVAASFIKCRLDNNESVIFVALKDGKPLGFTQLYPVFSSVRATKNWLLNDLYVHEDYRKQGIGEVLLQAAHEFAKHQGASFIELETSVDNFTAQKLYEMVGFIRQEANTASYYYRKAI